MQLRKKFGQRITVLIIILMLVPLIVVTLFTGFREVRSSREQTYQYHTKVVKSVQDQIGLLLKEVENVCAVLSTSEAITSMNPAKIDPILQSTIQAYDLITEMFVIGTDGMQIYNSSGPLGDRKDREYFQYAVRGQANFTDLLISKTTGKAIVVYALPIKKDGEVIGVLNCNLQIDTFGKLVQGLALGRTGETYILDRTGLVITHSNPATLAGTNLTDRLPIQHALQGEAGQSTYKLGDTMQLATYATVAGVGWGVVTEIALNEAFHEVNAQFKLMLLIITIALIVALIVSYLLARYITSPLTTLTEKVVLAANGKLDAAEVKGQLLERQDEFGQLSRGFNTMLGATQEIVAEIKNSIHTLSASATDLNAIVVQNAANTEEITAGITELAFRANSDTQSTQEGAEAIEQVARGAENIAAAAERLNYYVQETVDVANDGSQLMAGTAQAIIEAAQSANSIDQNMRNLEGLADNIENFVGIIINIADQTNLLALNAAIEAARAGDAGRGFAVVADEIRQLADQSTKAAKDIVNLVEAVQSGVNSSANIAKVTKDQLTQLVEKTRETQLQIEKIVADAEQVLTSTKEIAATSEEQAAATEQVTASMLNIFDSVQKTSSTTQEISSRMQEQSASLEQMGSMSEQLHAMGKEMKSLIQHFE